MHLELEVPTSWGEVTVGQFAELYPVLNSDNSTVLKTLQIISVVSGQPLDDLKNITNTTESIISLRDSIGFLDSMDQLGTVPENPWFYIGARRFSYNPHMPDMTAGQYITLTDLVGGIFNDHGKLYTLM